MPLCLLNPKPQKIEDFWKEEADKVRKECQKEEQEPISEKKPNKIEDSKLYM